MQNVKAIGGALEAPRVKACSVDSDLSGWSNSIAGALRDFHNAAAQLHRELSGAVDDLRGVETGAEVVELLRDVAQLLDDLRTETSTLWCRAEAALDRMYDIVAFLEVLPGLVCNPDGLPDDLPDVPPLTSGGPAGGGAKGGER
jgi:hypothetical protein